MIKILNVELQDFGRHKNLKLDLSGGLVGFTGPNGFGKSTILQAIQFGFSGRIDHEDKLSMFIRGSSGEKKPKKAIVILEFDADGRKCKITRTITANATTRELVVDGGAPVNADKAVQTIMQDLMGVNRDAINSTVFIPQGHISRMFGDDTERTEFYIRMLMLGHMSGIAEKINSTRQSVASSVVDYKPALDEADTAAQLATANFEEVDAELALARDYSGSLASLRNLNSKLGAVASHSFALKEAEDRLRSFRVVNYVGPDALAILLEAPRYVDGLNKEIGDYEKSLALVDSINSRHSLCKSEVENAASRLDQIRRTKSAHDALSLFEEEYRVKLVSPKIEAAGLNIQLAECARVARLKERHDFLSQYIATVEPELQVDADALAALQNKVTDLSAKVEESRASYRDTHKDYLSVSTLLQNASGACECEMCGSADFSTAYLEGRLKHLATEEQRITAEGTTLTAALRAEMDLYTPLSDAVKAKTAKIAASKSELESLGVASETRTVAEIQAAATQLEAQISYANNWNAELANLQQNLEFKKAAVNGVPRPSDNQIAEAEAAKSSCDAALAAAFAEVITSQTQAKRDELTKNIKEYKDLANQINSAAAVLQKSYDSHEAAHEDLRNTLADCVSSDPVAHEALAAVSPLTQESILRVSNEISEKQSAYDELRGKLKSAQDSMAAANARVTELQLRMRESSGTALLVDKLAKLRAAFMPTGAVGAYLRYKFDRMSELVGECLTGTGADFVVTPSQEIPLSYDFMRLNGPDEPWLPQSRMSGGQRVRLAVATLMAIHARLLPNLGLLVLDEPTTHVENDGVAAMAELFREIGNSGNLQLIICDHNPILTESFDKLIEIRS